MQKLFIDNPSTLSSLPENGRGGRRNKNGFKSVTKNGGKKNKKGNETVEKPVVLDSEVEAESDMEFLSEIYKGFRPVVTGMCILNREHLRNTHRENRI